MVTKEDVAQAAGVSTATVTRVLYGKGYVSEKARQKVMEAVTELKYHPNKVASNLAKKRSNVIGVLVEDLMNSYYTQIVEAMAVRANELDSIVSLFVVKNKAMQLVLDDLIGNRVCGVVNLAMFTCDEEHLKQLHDVGIRVYNFTDEDSRFVKVDYRPGMDQALALLKSKGHRNVAFVAGLEETLSKKDSRVKRFLERRGELGFSEDDRLIRYADYPKEKAHKVGYDMTISLIEEGIPFDAMFCLTDMMAMGAIKALTDRGLRVPQDVSLIGCDNLEFTGYFAPALTTIHVDKELHGRAYVDSILGLETGEVVISSSLVIRESVR